MVGRPATFGAPVALADDGGAAAGADVAEVGAGVEKAFALPQRHRIQPEVEAVQHVLGEE